MIKLFYLTHCPYCKNAFKAIEELKSEDPRYIDVRMETVEESERPDIAEKYDYYYVPTMFLNGQKLYEAHSGESFDECKENIRRVFEAELSAQ